MGMHIQIISFIFLLVLIQDYKNIFYERLKKYRKWLITTLLFLHISISIIHHQSQYNEENRISTSKILNMDNVDLDSVDNSYEKQINLQIGTDIFIFLLEGVNFKSWNEISKNSFKYNDSFLSIDHCFISVPHSSKSIYTLLTGEIQIEKSRSVVTPNNINFNLSKYFESQGYDTYFVFTQSFYLEGIDTYAKQFFKDSTDAQGLEEWGIKHNIITEKFPWGINDEILNDYVPKEILKSQKPIFSVIGFSNTHSPYFVSSRNPDSKKENLTSLQRFNSSLKQTIQVLNKLINKINSVRKTEPLIIILSDHGESFGENNFWKHNYSILNQETQIPCLIKNKIITNRNRISKASLSDFYPSIISIFNESSENSKAFKKKSNQDSYQEIFHSNRSRNFFSKNYNLEIPLKTWNVDSSLGYIQNDKKYILYKETGILNSMDLDESKIERSSSEKDINLFYSQWNRLKTR
ncbi:sulfatase-like hydrolase/transferase [Leptospira sp. GIMC2001]|uniref:sulfatase-like hydrolase/transferase n=1 Tax=Leptospira sp. GIMC2001 TaxID=1513297 RepID=UPI00234B3DF2|nr:sulfatase-like hydrolase/transferase [Leptospira sp. GIMC2001]WCL50105.1 sulfatase-like hydrolase/transferase [Leptospira sp. GIMC2001]